MHVEFQCFLFPSSSLNFIFSFPKVLCMLTSQYAFQTRKKEKSSNQVSLSLSHFAGTNIIVNTPPTQCMIVFGYSRLELISHIFMLLSCEREASALCVHAAQQQKSITYIYYIFSKTQSRSKQVNSNKHSRILESLK